MEFKALEFLQKACVYCLRFGLPKIQDPVPPPTPGDGPPPPGLPINESIVILLIVAIIIGYYFSKKYLNKKGAF